MSTLSKVSVQWSIDHFSTHGDTDIFPKIFEYKAIKAQESEILKLFNKQDICQWLLRAKRSCLVPKGKYSFRYATQLDPLDMIFFNSLIFEVAEEIEKVRIPLEREIVFSNRLAADRSGHLFFEPGGYGNFMDKCDLLSQQYPFVVVADISDFYHRIYFHRLENALTVALPNKITHTKAIRELIKGWNQNISLGIPVGNNPSRLLSELVISDIDDLLISKGITFCRFVDDFRLFARTEQDAYRQLQLLANLLYKGHFLTLHSHKTKIMISKAFRAEFIDTPENHEIKLLYAKFEEIRSVWGWMNPYSDEPMHYDDLDAESKKHIQSMNLLDILNQQLSKDEIDCCITRFVLSRLSDMQDITLIDEVVENIDKLFAIYPTVIKYLKIVGANLPDKYAKYVGAILLDKLDNSPFGELSFYRALTYSLFAGSPKWVDSGNYVKYYDSCRDSWSKRNIILAMGAAQQLPWFRVNKQAYETMDPWQRRAFLYGASCLPKDERDMYYKAIKHQSDPLDIIVIDWAKSNPIS